MMQVMSYHDIDITFTQQWMINGKNTWKGSSELGRMGEWSEVMNCNNILIIMNADNEKNRNNKNGWMIKITLNDDLFLYNTSHYEESY